MLKETLISMMKIKKKIAHTLIKAQHLKLNMLNYLQDKNPSL